MAYGNQGYVGISRQNSWGTAITTSHHFFPVISENLTDKRPRIQAEGMRTRYEAGPQFGGNLEFGGDVVTEIHPILVGKMLTFWSGADSATATGSYFTHAINPRQTLWDTVYSPLPPATIEVYRDAGSGMIFSDMVMNNFSLEFAQGKLLKGTWSWIGANGIKATRQTATYLQGSEFTFNQASISLNGAGITDISNLTIKGSNALEAMYTLDGTQRPNRVVRKGFRSIEISGTMILNGDTQKDIYIAGTSQRMELTVTGQAVTSGTNAVLNIIIPSFVYQEFPDNIGGPGLIEVAFKGIANYNTGSATMVIFSVVNSAVGY